MKIINFGESRRRRILKVKITEPPPCIIYCFGKAYLGNSFGTFSGSYLFIKLVAQPPNEVIHNNVGIYPSFDQNRHSKRKQLELLF